MGLEIYSDPCTINCHKVLAGLALLGTKYNHNYINYFEGEQKSDAYKKINPCATVPAAVDGDLVLTESNAILAYAADLEGGHSAYPKDLKKRADVNRWLLWEASVWFQTNYVYLIQNVVQELLGGKPDQAAIDKEAPNFHKAAAVLNDRLGERKWINGDDVTIADIAVAAPMHLHKEAKLPLENFPNISRWIAEIEKLPAWKETQVAVEKALVPNKAQSNGAASGGETQKPQ